MGRRHNNRSIYTRSILDCLEYRSGCLIRPTIPRILNSLFTKIGSWQHSKRKTEGINHKAELNLSVCFNRLLRRVGFYIEFEETRVITRCGVVCWDEPILSFSKPYCLHSRPVVIHTSIRFRSEFRFHILHFKTCQQSVQTVKSTEHNIPFCVLQSLPCMCSQKVSLLTVCKQPSKNWRKIMNNFYRATPCVSSVFAVARCLSVRLSRSYIVPRWLKISSNFFLVPVAPSL